MKDSIEKKGKKEKLEALESEVEELRNRSSRKNLAFYNVREKAEEYDYVAFIQSFFKHSYGLETLCGDVEIERRSLHA